MLFNDLLAKAKIDPAGVLVLRHTPRAEDGELLPWLASDHQVYSMRISQLRPSKSKPKCSKQSMWPRSSDWKSGKEVPEQAAVFVGLYKVGDHRPLTYEQFWKIPEYQELKKIGMRGFVKGNRPSVLWFDLNITEFHKNGRVS